MHRSSVKHRFVFCLLSIILFSDITTQAYAVPSVTNNTGNLTLRFGRLAAPTNGSSGTVTINAATGARTASGNIFLDPSLPVGRACFDVTFGALDLLRSWTFTLTVDTNPTNGSGTMTLTGFSLYTSPGAVQILLDIPILGSVIAGLLGLLDALTVCAGATLNVNDGQTPYGEYTGQINLQVH
jgi:hypothetical protein